jgi:hypothetical protein
MVKREESDVIFDDIDWRQFEELCYDLLLRSNYHSLVWRQGGGDQGRDIEAKKSSTNELVDVADETWFVECKHHSKSLQIEDISNKIEWAKAERPDHFMLMTSSYLSPGTRAWIEKIKAQVEFKIHIIEGKPLKQKILQTGLVDKYFLNDQQSKLKGIQKQWLNHDILPDEESFYHLYSTLEIAKLSTADLAFALFIFHQLNEKLENYCDSENLEMPTDIPVILALRKHKNYGYPIISEEELKQCHFSIPSPHYRSTTMSLSGSDLLIFLLKETINTSQLLDVLLKRENKTLEVRVSLRE